MMAFCWQKGIDLRALFLFVCDVYNLWVCLQEDKQLVIKLALFSLTTEKAYWVL